MPCSFSLVFLGPTMELLGFWETLWAVGITTLILKFLFMGVKCLILLVPSSLVTCRTQVSPAEFTSALVLEKRSVHHSVGVFMSSGAVVDVV